jgi:hypothetical protein
LAINPKRHQVPIRSLPERGPEVRIAIPLRFANSPKTLPSPKKFRLLIVDDEPLIRAGMRDRLFAKEDVEVAGDCGSVSEAFNAIRTSEVELILLDADIQALK